MVSGLVLAGTLELVALTLLDGRVTYVNPDAVVQLGETREVIGQKNTQFDDDVRCVITLVDNSFVSVRESCADVRELFARKKDGK